jgi:hypothetical protein
MNLKQFKILVLTLFVSGLVFTACQDKFNEEDFLNKQYSLDTAKQARQVAALNEAGKLLSYTVQVVEDGAPLKGVTVRISNSVSATAQTQEAITDDNGNAIFNNLPIGGNTIILSKTGYVTASATVNFPTPSVANGNFLVAANNGTITPIKLVASSRLPLFSNATAATASTAVVKGKVTIETDLTNTAPEAPAAPIQIKANFANAISTPSVGTATIANYVFTEGTLGIATTDASGNYNITVPALSDGLTITLDIPTIDGTQKVAVKQLNGLDIVTGPEYRQVPTTWGPTTTPDAIPTVIGATAVFPAPPAAGRGFAITFAPVGRTLDGTSITTDITTATNTTYAITNRGSNFTASPTVAITGGGGTGATATSSLRGFVTGMNVTGGGTGYPASTTLRIHFQYTDASGNPQFFSNPTDIFTTVTTTAGGVIPTGAITLPGTAGFIGNATPFITDFGAQGLTLKITDNANAAVTPTTNAAISITNVNELNAIQFTNVGSGFTSAPTITLSGGGAITQATVSVTSFRTQFDLTLGGSATTPYKVLPAAFNFFWAGNAADAAITETAKVDRLSPIGVIQSTNANLLSVLTTDGTNIMAIQANNKLRTTRFWTTSPLVDITDATTTQAKAAVTIATDGKISGLNTITAGAGYDTRFGVTIQPTITGAPGSGAAFALNETSDNTTRLVTWNATQSLLSAGSGYLQNLNQQSSTVAFSGTNTLTVKVGNTYIVDIKYGTGLKRETVN